MIIYFYVGLCVYLCVIFLGVYWVFFHLKRRNSRYLYGENESMLL